MIGSSVLGGLVFWMSDSIFSAAFDVLIKISESYSPQIPSTWQRANVPTLLVSPRECLRGEWVHVGFYVARESTWAPTWRVNPRGRLHECIRGAWAKWTKHSGLEYRDREGHLGPLGRRKYNRWPPLITGGLQFLKFFACGTNLTY